MSGMTPALLVALTDNYAAIAATLHDAHDALEAEVQAHKNAVVATGDTKLIVQLARHDSDFHRALNGETLCRTFLARQVIDLGGPIRDAFLPNVRDISSFAAYFNTGAGGPYQCLLSEGFANLFVLLNHPALRPADIRPPHCTNLGRREFGGAFRRGKHVDADKHAGHASPAIDAAGLGLTASRAKNAGRVVVTGTARDRDGIVREGREWAAEITAPHKAQEGDDDGDVGFPLTPAEEGDLLLSVSGIALPGNLSAGELTVCSSL